MKNNPFADLTSGDMSKYKERNDAAIRLERAEGLDARITDMNSKKKDLAWADLVFEFYDEEKRLNSDIFDIATKVPVLEQMKKEAKLIKEKDAEEKAQRKKDAEKKIAEEALAIDEYIIELSGAPRSIYWCDDVEKTDERVKNLPSGTRAKCKKLSVLDSLKEETGYVRKAAELDKEIKALALKNMRNQKWCESVQSVGKKVNNNIRPYMKEADTCVQLQKTAEDVLFAIAEEEKLRKKQEAERLARKKAEKARIQAENDARERAERAERERAERERVEAQRRAERAAEEAAARARIEAERKEELKRKRQRNRRKPVVFLPIILIALAIAVYLLFNRTFDVWVVCGLISLCYIAICNIIGLNSESIYDGAGYVIFNIFSFIAFIPLLCISAGTRRCAFVLALGIFISSFMLFIQSVLKRQGGEKLPSFGSICASFELSGIFAVIGFSLCFLSGISRYIFMGAGFVVLTASFLILSKKFNRPDSGWAAYSGIKIFAFLIAGVAFFIVGFFVDGFAILSMCAFLSASLCVFNYDEPEACWASLLFLIGVGLSLIPMLT